MKAILLVTGIILGGMFANEKLSTPHVEDSKTEIVYGHRIGPNGQTMLITSK